MAELHWTVQVRCVNALLAEVKVGEKGELIVDVPDRNFGPSEFDKLIEGLEVAGGIAAENLKSCKRRPKSASSGSSDRRPSGKVRTVRKRDL